MKYPKYITKLVGGPVTFNRIADGWKCGDSPILHPHDYDFAGPYDVADVDLAGIDSIKVRYQRHAEPFVLSRVSPHLWEASTGIKYMNCDVAVMLKTGNLIPVWEDEKYAYYTMTILCDGIGIIAQDGMTPTESARGFRVTDLDTVERVGNYTRNGDNCWVSSVFEEGTLVDKQVLELTRNSYVVLSEKSAVIERKAKTLHVATAKRDHLVAQRIKAFKLYTELDIKADKASDDVGAAHRALREVM